MQTANSKSSELRRFVLFSIALLIWAVINRKSLPVLYSGVSELCSAPYVSFRIAQAEREGYEAGLQEFAEAERNGTIESLEWKWTSEKYCFASPNDPRYVHWLARKRALIEAIKRRPGSMDENHSRRTAEISDTTRSEVGASGGSLFMFCFSFKATDIAEQGSEKE